MGTTAREDISTTKKDLISSKGVVFAPRTIQFAHQFVGAETSLNMLSLTTPSLLSGNGFINASPQEIAGANLSVFGKNLKLSLSRGIELKPYVHYLIANNNIVFIGALKDNGGALTDEILFGEIQMAAGNAQIVGDVRFVRGTVEVAVGQTLVNLGERFKVNENPGSQIGDVKIKRNGVGIYRNVGNATASLSADGNYQEMDSGTGYGVSITLNEPPIGQADLIEYEIGVQLSSGDLALWDQFQRLQGSILALSQDAAQGFYGDANYSRYLSVSPSDLDRKAYGDSVVAQAARITSVESRFGVWQAYTPVVTQDGTAASVEIINGVVRYKVIDKTVFLQGWIILGRLAAGVGGTFIRVSLPISGKTGLTQVGLGSVHRQAATANTTMTGAITLQSANVTAMLLSQFTGGGTNVTPGDAASGLGISVVINGSYEID